MGLRQLTVREVARDKSLASKYLGNIVVMKIILVVISISGVWKEVSIFKGDFEEGKDEGKSKRYIF